MIGACTVRMLLNTRVNTQLQVYNGDTDPCVSYEGTRTAITRVGFAELDGGGYRPWFYNHTAASLRVIEEKAALFGPDLNPLDTGAQFGGEVVNYEQNLQFVTFHGSGHMVSDKFARDCAQMPPPPPSVSRTLWQRDAGARPFLGSPDFRKPEPAR